MATRFIFCCCLLLPAFWICSSGSHVADHLQTPTSINSLKEHRTRVYEMKPMERKLLDTSNGPDVYTPYPATYPVTVPASVPSTTTPLVVPVTNPTIVPYTAPTITTPSNPITTNPTTFPLTPYIDNPAPPVTVPSTIPSFNPVPTSPVITNPAAPVTIPTVTPTTPATLPTVVSPTVSGQSSWCIARKGSMDASLQLALDYACGIGGADCSVIQQNGVCYNPNTLEAHASYAFNSYYQKNQALMTSCNFGGTAMLVTVDPSSETCIYSATSSSSTILNTTSNPISSTVFGPEPPGIPSSAATTTCLQMLSVLISAAAACLFLVC